MRVLLLGAGGFIGGQLKIALERDYDVQAPTSTDVDLLNIDDVSKLGSQFDVVINSASTFKAGKTCLDDVIMDNILKVYPNSRHVYLGTMSETSKSGLIFPWDGEPNTEYGRKKRICSKMLSENSSQYINLRLFGVFGRGEAPTRLVPSIIKTLNNKQPMVLSRGTQIRDFVNVQVVGKCIEYILENDMFSGVSVNIGSGTGISIKNLIYNVAQQSELEFFQFNVLPDKVTDIDSQVADLSQTIDVFPKYIEHLSEFPTVIRYIKHLL